MIRAIINALTGSIGDKLAEAYAARHNAKTEQERIAAEVTIAQMQERQANRAMNARMIGLAQFAFIAPYAVYRAKILIWDKVLGWGVTDPLSAQLLTTEQIIIVFLFGQGIVRAIRR